eukprot:scaffold25394_cov16-Tisochrysis_lutea.AAC.1
MSLPASACTPFPMDCHEHTPKRSYKTGAALTLDNLQVVEAPGLGALVPLFNIRPCTCSCQRMGARHPSSRTQHPQMLTPQQTSVLETQNTQCLNIAPKSRSFGSQMTSGHPGCQEHWQKKAAGLLSV